MNIDEALQTWAWRKFGGCAKSPLRVAATGNQQQDFELVVERFVEGFISQTRRLDGRFVALKIAGHAARWNFHPLRSKLSCLIELGHGELSNEPDSLVGDMIEQRFRSDFALFVESNALPEFVPCAVEEAEAEHPPSHEAVRFGKLHRMIHREYARSERNEPFEQFYERRWNELAKKCSVQ